jgi:phosphoglycerate dehydrogenase-like enzyme
MSAGVDRFLTDDMIRSPVLLTNVSGIHAVPISEYVMAAMLMLAKQMPRYFELKQEKKWQRFSAPVLGSKILGIVGLGHIGREVARLAKAFGMRVLATRRSIRRVSRVRNVDKLLPSTALPELLAESDFVALTLPSTPETKNLIGERELRMMKPSGYLINIGRGTLIDEAALVRALRENWISGAALDVFATEPLPRESQLWELPNLIYSPHISGGVDDYLSRSTDLFCENLKRYVSGKKLFNVVNKRLGY